MKIPAWLATALFIAGGGLIGWLAIWIIAFNSEPPPPSWDKVEIFSGRPDVIDILFIDHTDFTEKIIDDTVYVQTESGDVYSIFHREWQLLPSLPDGKTIQKIRLRDGYEDSPIVAITDENDSYQFIDNQWDLIQDYEEFSWGGNFYQCEKSIPVENNVLDSEGVEFEHAIAAFYKCYILQDDGSLSAWTRTSSGIYAIAYLWYARISCVFGAILGGIVSLVIRHFKKQSLVVEETENDQ